MSNPYTKENAAELAEECIKLANERFGYRLGLRMALVKLGFNEEKIKEATRLAQQRKVQQLEELFK